MRWRAIGLFILSGMALAAEPVRSGKATMELIAAQRRVEVGKPVLLGLRMTLDPGWHTYWSNPGESGMKPRVRWDLPEGFEADEPLFPFPEPFSSSGLTSFGYGGEVIFPVWVRWPETTADIPDEIALSVRVDWLTCNDDACIPGRADLALALPVEAAATPGPNAEALAAALERTPEEKADWHLRVEQKGTAVRLEIEAPTGVSLAAATAFPATEQALDPQTPLAFVESENGRWIAETQRNEYAAKPLDQLELAIRVDGERPVAVRWAAAKDR